MSTKQKNKVFYITNASPQSGLGMRSEALRQQLQQRPDVEVAHLHLDGQEGTLYEDNQEIQRLRPWPGPLASKTIGWIRLGKKVPARLPREQTNTIVDLTNQTLSFLVAKTHLPTVVTVHDLIELLEPQTATGQLFARYLYRGVTNADHVIAVSEYTATTITDRWRIPSDKITVIPNAVGSEFHPLEQVMRATVSEQLRRELHCDPHAKIILYVGSEHPRKNLSVALRAVASVQQQIPNLVFLKVGEPGIKAGRAALMHEMKRLKLTEHVRFIDQVTTPRLNELYNCADALLFPSRFEGFGLPPLQAMVAGTPVITSNATSLPEVVGSAGLMYDPDDVAGFTNGLEQVLTNSQVAQRLREQGLQRARQFMWSERAAAVANVYQKVLQARA